MFHFPALPSTALCIQAGTTAHDDGRVSPFGHPRINARLPAPRGLSQAPTSFIGSWCQDIHRMLLKTWLNYTEWILQRRTQSRRLDARVHCAVLKIRTEQATRPSIRKTPVTGRSRQRPKRSGCSLRTQQRARCPRLPRALVPQPPRREERTNRAVASRETPNNQCSTRKHGHRGGHSPPDGAGAP
jgi:hypothetical protein